MESVSEPVLLSRLVESLCGHFTKSSDNGGSSAVGSTHVSPAQLMDVAAITAQHLFLAPTEATALPVGAACRAQLEGLVKELEHAVAGEGRRCAPASVCALTALTLLAVKACTARDGGTCHAAIAVAESHANETNEVECFLSTIARRSEECFLHVLKSFAPYPAEAQAAVQYCAAQLIVRGGDRLLPHGSRLLEEACAVVAHVQTETDRNSGPKIDAAASEQRSATAASPANTAPTSSATMATLSRAAAVELLSQCAALLVVCDPPHLGSAVADPDSMGLGRTQGGQDGKGGRKEEGKRAARKAGNEERSKGTTAPGAAGSEGPDQGILLPVPRTAVVASLRARLVECSLQALGGAATMPITGATGGLGAGTDDATTAAVLCRRILIPLLLMGDDNCAFARHSATAHYHQQIEALLYSLAGTEGEAVVSAPVADCQRRSEAIVIIAALFDYLFSSRTDEMPSAQQADYRASPFLWRLLVQSLWDAMTCAELDAGHRASMELRSGYLLKRIVDLCKKDAHASTMVYHEYFSWTPALTAPTNTKAAAEKGKGKKGASNSSSLSGSEASWELFFLVLETLNEYGLHIVVPALTKLDALVAVLQARLEQPSDAAKANSALAACWVEVLFLKLTQHPNVGVRKVGLRRLWLLPPSVLGSFSERFLYGAAFASAADPRLCSDLDRVPITASFLEAKGAVSAGGSGGSAAGQPSGEAEARTVPEVEPLAQSIERFYAALFCTHLRSGAARTSALLRLFTAVAEKPAKFTTTVFARLLCHLAHTLCAEAAAAASARTPQGTGGEVAQWTVEMVLDARVLACLDRLLRTTMQENMDLCLEVRIVALLFDALLHFAALAPDTFRWHDGFWQVLCLCGPLGHSGGARLDACGTYGATGASVDVRLLNRKLLSVSRELHKTFTTATAAGASTHEGADREREGGGRRGPFWLVDELLQPGTLVARTERLLRDASHTSVAPPDGREAGQESFAEADIKAHFFLVGALLLTGTDEHRRVVHAVADRVAQTVASLRARAYASDAGLLTALAAMVELLHTTVSGDNHVQGLFSGPMLSDMIATVFVKSQVTLEAGLVAATSDTELTAPVWQLLHTTRWDVLAAAGMTLLQASSTSQSQCDSSQELAQVEWLLDFLARCAAAFVSHHTSDGSRTASSQRSGNAGDDAASARAYALIVVARDASRMLQSLLCGVASVPSLAESERNATAESLWECEGCSREVSRMGCFLNGLTATRAAELIEKLTRVVPQRMTAAAANTSYLSSQSSSSTLAEHFRYVYNSIFVLCQRVFNDSASIQDEVTVDVAHLCSVLAEFGLEQVEQCSTHNLACVYDLLTWVVMAAPAEGSVPGVDREAIVSTMFHHVQDASAKQFVRVSSLAYNALQHIFPSHPDFVVEKLTEALGEDEESDRTTYFVAVTAALLVLENPQDTWPLLKDVLLGVAVFFNSSRDGEDNEASLATTEPLLASWPDALRILYPPTVRMATVGRALALATILRCCWLDHAATGGEAVAAPLCLTLLKMNAFDPVVTHEPCMPNSRTHRVRIRLWQLLVLLLPCLPQAREGLEPIFDALVQYCIPAMNMGSVRRYMEIFAVQLMRRQPSLYEPLAQALDTFDLRPQVCGTFVLVACHALLHDEETQHRQRQQQSGTETEPGKEPEESALFSRLFPLVLQQTTSNQHLLRIISHSGLYKLSQAREAHGKRMSRDAAAVVDYITRAPEHVKFRDKYMPTLFYDTDEAATPRSVLCVVRKEANTILRESIPAAAFERMRFVETETCCLIGALYPAERLRARLIGTTRGPRDVLAAGPSSQHQQPQQQPTHRFTRATQTLSVFRNAPWIPHTARRAEYYVDFTAEAAQALTTDPLTEAGVEDGTATGAEAMDNIQKKITPWWGSEVYNELHPRALHTGPPGSGGSSNGGRRQRIIVVGSLLLNPVNIAGLCRCGEIFAVEQIVIPEKKVFEHPHFIATARSAELWIPWAEVPPRDLPAYLMEKRREGYTICGIEQTAGSVSMASFNFPDKVVVVLGSEGQGIPAPLLPMLEVCVEIPQYGLIRSLNVHVTGALVMYEYTKQHRMVPEAAALAVE